MLYHILSIMWHLILFSVFYELCQFFSGSDFGNPVCTCTKCHGQANISAMECQYGVLYIICRLQFFYFPTYFLQVLLKLYRRLLTSYKTVLHVYGCIRVHVRVHSPYFWKYIYYLALQCNCSFAVHRSRYYVWLMQRVSFSSTLYMAVV